MELSNESNLSNEEAQNAQRGIAATQRRPTNARHKEAQNAQKGIPFAPLVPFCGQKNLVGLRRFGGKVVQRLRVLAPFRSVVAAMTDL